MNPLSSTPELWMPHEMWGIVNSIRDMTGEKGLRGEHLTVARSSGNLGIRVSAIRPSVIAEHGYSKAAQLSDEIVRVLIEDQDVILEVCEGLHLINFARLLPIMGMASVASRNPCFRAMQEHLTISIGDHEGPGVDFAFSTSNDKIGLLPDPYFFITRAYEADKKQFSDVFVPWTKRFPEVYWRGAPTGLSKYTSERDSQRVKLLLLAHKINAKRDRSLINAKLVGSAGLSPDLSQELASKKLYSDFENQSNITNYRYNVDVDGESSAWQGLFLKLAAGSVVLKIESDRGFKQWYYKDLLPWVHFVPIDAGLADFEVAVDFLSRNPDIAELIAAQGAEFANNISYDASLAEGANKLASRAMKKRLSP